MSLSKHVVLAVVGSAVILAQPAFACPVCFSQANQSVLETYYLTTVVMSLLPLAFLGSIGMWLYRRQRGRQSLAETP